MTLRASGLVLFGLLLSGPLMGAAYRHARSEELQDVVRGAATAHERVGYRGEVAWRTKRHWSRPVHVTHDATSGRTRYRWPRGFRFVVPRPSARTPDPAAWCLDVDALLASYEAREGTPGEFLGRGTRVLILAPLHDGRPELHVTVDRQTLLPLQVVSYAAPGRLYRVAAFREIEIGPRTVEPQHRRWDRAWFGTSVPHDRLAESAGFGVLEPAYLPEGFRCIDCRVGEGFWDAVRLRYSDGATTFELTQHVVPTPAQMETAFGKMGPRHAQRMVRWHLQRRLQALAESGGGDAALVRRHAGRTHRTYDLRVGDVELKLVARADLGGAETLRVLRSLHAAP